MNVTDTVTDISNLRIAVLGAGKMGGILLQAFLDQKLFAPEQILATVAHLDRAATLSTQWGVKVSTDNVAAAGAADLILLGVKPFQIPGLMEEIRPALTGRKVLISFAASVKTSAIEDAAGMEISVIRAMPNTPSMLGAGAAALCRGRFVRDEQMSLAERIFQTVGRTVVVDEKHMDAVTGLSASGPAFIYIILESLAEAGVKVGLPRDVATLLAAQTTYGAATNGARNRLASCPTQGPGHHSRRLHHRRHSGTRRRRPPRHTDQGRHARSAARQGTREQLSISGA